MKLMDAKMAARVALYANIAMLFQGPPGGGKSSGIAQLCQEEDYCVLDWRLSELESVDMRGTPHGVDGFTIWFPPGELPRLLKNGMIEYSDKGVKKQCKKLVILLDEFDKPDKAVKNVTARLLLERRIGEWIAPPQVRFLCAGNRMSDGAGGSPMPTFLANRLWILEVQTDFNDWMENFVEPRESGQPPLPTPQFKRPLRAIQPGEIIPIDPRVVAYLKYQSEALYARDPTSKEPSFASNRSWHMLSDMLYCMNGNEDDLSNELFQEYCKGFVGVYGGNFASFSRTIRSLVKIEQILLDPNNAPLVKEASHCYAVATSLAHQVNRKTIGAGFTYLRRISNELANLFSAKIEKIQPALKETKPFMDWQADPANKL